MISPPLIVSFTYKHFQTKLHVIDFSIQVQKCVAWSPFGLFPDFNTPSQFYTPSKGIKILRVPLGTSSFTSSFIKDVLLKDVRHVDLFKVTFGIVTHCFVQWPSYFLWCTPFSSTVIKSLISFDSSLFKVCWALLGFKILW